MNEGSDDCSRAFCCQETLVCCRQIWVRTFVSSRQVSESTIRLSACNSHAKYVRAYLEGAEQALVDAHHCTSIVEFTTVVGCAKQRYKLALREEFVSVLHNLMSTADEVHVVFLQEARYYVWSKCEADASVVLAPPSDVLVRVGP
jgi:hypothetical protein